MLFWGLIFHRCKMGRWDELKIFLAVARSGTLTMAAEELGASSSTLHRRLAALEESVGAELFEKGPRGYRLTLVGEALLPHAEEVEEAVFAARRAVIGHDRQASGEVRITLPLAMLPLVSSLLADFSRAGSRVQPVLQANDVLLDLERETDIALRATTRPDEAAVGRRLFGIAWGLYAPARADEGACPWVHYFGMDASPAVRWRKSHYPDAEPMMFVQGVAGMHAVLSASAGKGLLPCFVGDADPGLRRIGEPVSMSELWVLVHADSRRSARVRAVLDFLIPALLERRASFEALG